MNAAALALEEQLGFDYASDARGSEPFVPLIDGRRSRVLQMPTTLPTLDELIGLDGRNADNVHEVLLAHTAGHRGGYRDRDPHDVQPDHGPHRRALTEVFTLHAELEGMKLLPVMRRLIEGWAAQGHELVSLATLCATLDREALPACKVVAGTVPGRSGELACQQS